jgi:hypothetical protein
MDHRVRSRPDLPTAVSFPLILAAFGALVAFSWPTVMSFDLWVFKDRSSFLNLDYLLDQHLRLGVDADYGYGLLPVLLQRAAFALFGRGYGPMLGYSAVVLVLMACLWALLLRRLPNARAWLGVVILLSPLLLWVNPNFPNSLLQLSILYALLFVTIGRIDVAFAIATVGCWCVPSLTLVMAALLALAIVVDWALRPGPRSAGALARELGPGIAAYLAVGALLMGFFGVPSTLATALPLEGAAHYRAVGYGMHSLLAFLHPAGHPLRYYLGYYAAGSATWWIFSMLLLLVLGTFAVVLLVRRRRLEGPPLAVALGATIMILFASLAYGSPQQHIVYDPILALAVITGLALLPLGRSRIALALTFALWGTLGHVAADVKTIASWKQTRPLPATIGLYANPAWAAEWSNIVDLSRNHRLMLLSYATGMHHYFPTVGTAEAWFLQPGQLLPSDVARLYTKMDGADVIVEDLSGPTTYIDGDSQIQGRLDARCLTSVTPNFKVWGACRHGARSKVSVADSRFLPVGHRGPHQHGP